MEHQLSQSKHLKTLEDRDSERIFLDSGEGEELRDDEDQDQDKEESGNCFSWLLNVENL